MKIIHIVHWPKSGIVNLLYNILSEQNRSDDINCYVIFLKNDFETTKKFSEVTRYVGSLSGGVYSPKSIIALHARIKSISPDIIHVHSFLPHLYTVLLKNKIPLFRTIHSDYPYFHKKQLVSFIKRSVENALLKKSDAVISVSNSLAEELKKTFKGVNFNVISNGIYLRNKEDTRQSVLKSIGVPNDALVYITVGRLEDQKGFDLLVSAFSRSVKKYEKIYLLIIGEGSQYEKLKNDIKRNDVSEKIKLLGYQNSPYKYLSASDIYITSSRYEGLPLSVMEAQGIGLPVIGFNVTGVRDVVLDGVTGMLERKVDDGSLEKLVNYSIDNTGEIRDMGYAAEKRVKEMFTISKTAKDYCSLYKKTLFEVSDYQ